MYLNRELRFLCEVMEKSHLDINILPKRNLGELLGNFSIGGLYDTAFSEGGELFKTIFSAEGRTLYRITDSLYRRFIFLLLEGYEEQTLLFIGPFLSSPVTENAQLALAERLHISVKMQRYLSEYYSSLPIIQPDGHLMIMLNTFCEWLWRAPTFAIVELDREGSSSEIIADTELDENVSNEILVNIEAVERRYAYEKELLSSVALGKLHIEDQLTSVFSPELFEKRASNPLRNAKNYAIIMNTLLRKSAEEGGVHPYYIDKTSSMFAYRIENLASQGEIAELMRDMFRKYCRLVRSHNTKGYSTNTGRAILIIDADLSQDLSSRAIARALGISTPYLSSIFKREVGKTITEYVLERRMRLAERLIRRTELQIQTIAQHCGIMDVQYFSKLFKKRFNMSPSEYRKRVT